MRFYVLLALDLAAGDIKSMRYYDTLNVESEVCRAFANRFVARFFPQAEKVAERKKKFRQHQLGSGWFVCHYSEEEFRNVLGEQYAMRGSVAELAVRKASFALTLKFIQGTRRCANCKGS